jgi:hypothetical protein
MTIGSTLSQKVTARQYALREQAVGLGWETSRIVVIDQDLGQKGGFRRRS